MTTEEIVDAREFGARSVDYQAKPASYFDGARFDIVQRLRTDPQASILELGCGSGGTARAVRAAGKAGRYVGIEINPDAAARAAEDLDELIIGDVQTLDLSAFESRFDAVIASEVLEHLSEPWTTVVRLAECLRPGGIFFASSPNIANLKVIQGLFNGRFEYEDAGVMDRTHLRWFTPASFRTLFEKAGLEVLESKPMVPLGWKASLLTAITGGRYEHLFATQTTIVARRPALQAPV